jgi:hypothetical protein
MPSRAQPTNLAFRIRSFKWGHEECLRDNWEL